ncbi:MAG: hypothetical protein IPL53_22750 [Ignavibacteria bacterium]|nr:hypothetical protein [Ignavibacteria bacterium]
MVGGFTNVDGESPSTSSAQITNYINGGVSWIWFIGHGSETSWADPVWSMSNMVNLNYGDKTAFHNLNRINQILTLIIPRPRIVSVKRGSVVTRTQHLILQDRLSFALSIQRT